MESQQNDINSIFTKYTKMRSSKTYRYLNGENQIYRELKFSCSMAYKEEHSLSLLDIDT